MIAQPIRSIILYVLAIVLFVCAALIYLHWIFNSGNAPGVACFGLAAFAAAHLP
jgi:flagellar basal body-associated protein FliL